uniref:Uncharacterized protein n=1 Tax=Anguilla anguilla TaxID=7936 RepID=A0A0E9SYV7_ANGAN
MVKFIFEPHFIPLCIQILLSFSHSI